MKESLLVLLMVLAGTASAISLEDRIQIKTPTVQEETEYVWRTIIDIQFFTTHNYEITLPEGQLIDELKKKSKRNELTDRDFERLQQYMKSEVYKPSDYERGFQRIKTNEGLINKLINKLHRIKKEWTFKTFKKYEVKLTLYGPGGSYDPETGSILIYTTKAGAFKQYDNPANTIIHEIMHIGTEASIMNKYDVPHPLKERIVDQLVLINFGKYLPEYRLQGFGDSRIDPYLRNKEDIRKLDEVIAQFQEDHRQ